METPLETRVRERLLEEECGKKRDRYISISRDMPRKGALLLRRGRALAHGAATHDRVARTSLSMRTLSPFFCFVLFGRRALFLETRSSSETRSFGVDQTLSKHVCVR